MSDHPAARRINQSIQLLHLMMRSCESCRQNPYDLLIHETFVCQACAEVAA